MVTQLDGTKSGVGPPEVINRKDAGVYLAAIAKGLTQDQAAAFVMHSRQGMELYLQRHAELHARVGRAKATKILRHIRTLDRISSTRDVKGFNAAVRASEIILSANDERFKKVKEGGGPGGFGVQIIVESGIPAPLVTTFMQQGGEVTPEAAISIESRGTAAITAPAAAPAARYIPQDVGEPDEEQPDHDDQAAQHAGDDDQAAGDDEAREWI